MRWGFNFFPAFRGTGARVTYMSGVDADGVVHAEVVKTICIRKKDAAR
jgi:hypothetical protein